MSLAYKTDVRRMVFLKNIERKPEQIEYRGNTYIARFAELSFERNMQLAAFEGRSDNMELLLALNSGDAAPEPQKERLKDYKGIHWLITNVRKDIGENCYVCTVNRINK
jgi:hypothetical protein